MKNFSTILIVISGLFSLNNFFGADGKYHNSKEMMEQLEKTKIINSMDMINISKTQDIILNLQRSLDSIIDFKKKDDNPTKVNINLFHLTSNGQSIVIPANWSFSYSGKEAIAGYINLITDIAIGVFAYNNIYNTQLQEKINQYLLTRTKRTFCSINTGELKILSKDYINFFTVGHDNEYASFDFLKSLDSSKDKSEANKIIANLTKLYSQIPDLKKDYVNNNILRDDDRSFTDYDFNGHKSSKEVMESFSRIVQKIFVDLGLSHFKLEKNSGSKDKNWSFKIGNDSMTVFEPQSGQKKLTSLVTEKKLVNVQDVKEIVEKIDFAGHKKEDKDPSNKFKDNNPGSSNDSSNSDPQGGKRTFGLRAVIVTGFGCLALGTLIPPIVKNITDDKESKINKNIDENTINYYRPDQSFDKLQTVSAAA